jgi:putative thioredoxin
LDPARPDAALALARILHERGQLQEALEVLARVHGSFAADGLTARIRLESAAAPDLAAAFEALDSGHTDRALEMLISAVRPTRPDRDDIRRIVVGILDELGLDDPLAATSRARLASALY